MKTKIVYHHTADPQDSDQAEKVKLEHLNNPKIRQNGAYHYLLEKSGKIVQFRPEDSIGYHAGNWIVNIESIGICLAGDLRPEKQEPTEAQIASLRSLTKEVQLRWNIPHAMIFLHREIKATECPGRDLRTYLESVSVPKLSRLQKAMRFAKGTRKLLLQKAIERLSKQK